MGAGNVCVWGQCEGLYYVDNGFLSVYQKIGEDGQTEYAYLRDADDGYEYSECLSMFEYDEFKYRLAERLIDKFPSFERVDKFISRTRKALLENELFYIVCEDNQWSTAVELIQKEGIYGDEKIGLQMGLYRKYLKGIETVLLDMYGEVRTYAGTWTSGIIRRNND